MIELRYSVDTAEPGGKGIKLGMILPGKQPATPNRQRETGKSKTAESLDNTKQKQKHVNRKHIKNCKQKHSNKKQFISITAPEHKNDEQKQTSRNQPTRPNRHNCLGQKYLRSAVEVFISNISQIP